MGGLHGRPPWVTRRRWLVAERAACLPPTGDHQELCWRMKERLECALIQGDRKGSPPEALTEAPILRCAQDDSSASVNAYGDRPYYIRLNRPATPVYSRGDPCGRPIGVKLSQAPRKPARGERCWDGRSARRWNAQQPASSPHTSDARLVSVTSDHRSRAPARRFDRARSGRR
jgi:hypothetical protein